MPRKRAAGSQAPHGFGAPYRGFPAFLSPSNCLKTARLRRLQFSLCYPLLAIRLFPLERKLNRYFLIVCSRVKFHYIKSDNLPSVDKVRLREVPLLLSPSCVTRKKTSKKKLAAWARKTTRKREYSSSTTKSRNG